MVDIPYIQSGFEAHPLSMHNNMQGGAGHLGLTEQGKGPKYFSKKNGYF